MTFMNPNNGYVVVLKIKLFYFLKKCINNLIERILTLQSQEYTLLRSG